MTTKIITKGPTEADFEEKIGAAVRKTFPWLPGNELKHQLQFSFTIGRATVEIDGMATTAQGRTDILVYAHGKPLAVLELKRPGLALTLDDEAQGLSYAKVLTPSFPLVVLTNGDETRKLATYSGEAWEPDTPSEAEFAKLVAAAGRAATGDLKQAVSTLMGSSPAVWLHAVRAVARAYRRNDRRMGGSALSVRPRLFVSAQGDHGGASFGPGRSSPPTGRRRTACRQEQRAAGAGAPS